MTLQKPTRGAYSVWPASTGGVPLSGMTNGHLKNVRDYLASALKRRLQTAEIYEAWLDEVYKEQQRRAEVPAVQTAYDRMLQIVNANIAETKDPYVRQKLRKIRDAWRADIRVSGRGQ